MNPQIEQLYDIVNQALEGIAIAWDIDDEDCLDIFDNSIDVIVVDRKAANRAMREKMNLLNYDVDAFEILPHSNRDCWNVQFRYGQYGNFAKWTIIFC